jgi:Mg-chelatase subunit ChlD
MASRQARISKLLVVAFAMAISVFAVSDAVAIDRSQARFRKFLIGTNDGVRAQAMQSIPRDYESRHNALPIVIRSLESLREDPRFDRAAKQGQPDLPRGVRLMIDFIGTVDLPDATEALVELLNCDRTSWRMAAVQSLGKNQRRAALDDLISLMDSDSFESSYGFRFTLARSLKDMNHPDAWEGLAILFNRVDGQLAHRLDDVFQTVTAADFADDATRFEDWKESVGLLSPDAPRQKSALDRAAEILSKDGESEMPEPKRMGLQSSQSAVSYSRQLRLTPSHYYGINIYAKRLLFVIDRSGSMQDVVLGQTRIQRAKRELITAINGLDEQCEFGILIFDKDVSAWREELVQATTKNKRSAIQFVNYLVAGKTTNTYGALRRSLEFDDQLEAIFLLTDGKPTTGLITHPAAILMDILSRNESHNITINTIAIAVEPVMETFLRKLTEPSDGEFRKVN